MPRTQQIKNVPARPTGHNQRQGHGHGQAHLGECALTLASPSTLTSFSYRRAIRATSCNAACAGEQPWGEHDPNAKCSQCARATDPGAGTQMAHWQCVDTSELPGCHRTRWLVVDECVGHGSCTRGLWCKPMSLRRRAAHSRIDSEAGSIPEFYEDCRLEDPVDAVLSTCSTLLAIVDDQGSLVIQFSHFSVKKFLTSTRLAEAAMVI